MPSTRQRGSDWEKAAESFLRKKGLKPVARNYHGRFGEIDLVMLDRSSLVFIEVRFRANSDFGTGADSVTLVKQRRIVAAARRYLQYDKRHANRPCRFDVISIGMEQGHPVMKWIKAAFDAS